MKGLQFGWHGVKSYERGDAEINISIRKRLLIGSVSIIFILLFLLFYPIPFNLGYGFPMGLPDFILIPVKTASSLFVFNQDVYDVMSWLRTDTPDPGVDYYGLYKEPPVNKTTGEIKDYAYPKQAYGILAEWGLGHTITYYSHRIPVANPFQQGVGKINKDGTIEPGQTTFFLQTDEKKATKMLDELRSPYVISDAGEANADHGFQQMIKWVQGNFDGYLVPGTKNIDMNKFLNSMIARLHLYNGSETISDVGSAGNIFVKSLDHFRLLYESKTTAFSLKNSVENDIKQYKVFEYVKGVQIAGKTVPGNQVEISADIKTNQGVDFVYKKTTTADNGSFDFVVPYSTGKQEKSDVSAGAYTIKIGNYTKSVKISEEDVLQGKVINL